MPVTDAERQVAAVAGFLPAALAALASMVGVAVLGDAANALKAIDPQKIADALLAARSEHYTATADDVPLTVDEGLLDR